ncbi:MAG: nucleotidyltransferase family protein [Candidatus Eremiobacteraeota bacterium]|nr:nucleotidyltransferase family protein [Candidatus Eremiobacteraeota bacterium]
MIGRIGCVILAGGESRRFGADQHKLLARLGERPLLQYAIDAATRSHAMSCTLVVGARAQRLLDVVDPRRCAVVRNASWREGIASSLRAGLANHLGDEACIFMVADQPLVQTADLDRLITAHRADRDAIVALQSGTIWGTPMLLPRRFFAALARLRGDAGAKRIAQTRGVRLRLISALSTDAFADVDTPADLDRLDQMEPRT